MILLIIIAMFLVACGDDHQFRQTNQYTPVHQDRPIVLEPSMQVYIDEFYFEAERREVETSKLVGTANLVDSYPRPESVGMCSGWIDPKNKIEVRRDLTALRSYWEKASDWGRRIVIFHELGHCALGLDHSDSDKEIMSPFKINDVYAEWNWPELVDNLFASKPTTLKLTNEGNCDEQKENNCDRLRWYDCGPCIPIYWTNETNGWCGDPAFIPRLQYHHQQLPQ